MLIAVKNNKKYTLDPLTIKEITPDCERIFIEYKDKTFKDFDKLIFE